MARKRMLDPEIWESCYDKGLTSDDFTVLCAAISSADDEGRGKLSMIERNVGKMLKPKQLETSLKNLNDTIFIYLKEYYYLPNWNKYQTINRPKESKLPAPPDAVQAPVNDESVINHTHVIDVYDTSKVKLSKVEVEEEVRGNDASAAEVTKLFAIWGRAPDPGERAIAQNLLKQFDFDRMKRAFYTASSAGPSTKTLRYVKGILTNPEKSKTSKKEERKIGA